MGFLDLALGSLGGVSEKVCMIGGLGHMWRGVFLRYEAGARTRL